MVERMGAGGKRFGECRNVVRVQILNFPGHKLLRTVEEFVSYQLLIMKSTIFLIYFRKKNIIIIHHFT